MDQIRDRLGRIERAVDNLSSELHEVDERTGRIEAQLAVEAETMRGLIREVGGISEGDPHHRPLRARVHDLEGNEATLRAADAALTAARAVRNHGWSATQKAAVTGAAIIAAGVSIYNAIIGG